MKGFDFNRPAIPGAHQSAAQGSDRTWMLRPVVGGLILMGTPAADAASTAALDDYPREIASQVVQLPPFLVSAESQPLPWRFGSFPGWEVLSLAEDEPTRELANGIRQLEHVLGELLPEEFRSQFSAPAALIVCDHEHARGFAGELLERQKDAQSTAESNRWGGARVESLQNLRLWDRDVLMIYVTLPERGLNVGTLQLKPDYVRFRMDGAVPGLPAWYRSGVMALFEAAKFDGDSLVLARLPQPPEAAATKKPADPDEPSWRMIPFEVFFAHDATTDDLPEINGEVWRWQAAALLHWSLADEEGTRASAFRTLVRRAAAEPVTETLLVECLGLDFATLAAQVRNHVENPERERESATRRTLRLRPPGRLEIPNWRMRKATDEEVARITGDWQRLEARVVRAERPGLAWQYLDGARRALRRPLKDGAGDPLLLALLGLCEVDDGNAAAARDHLERAVAANIVRPRVYHEVARLRYDEAREQPAGVDGFLSAAQLASVTIPLNRAMVQSPPLPECYLLYAVACSSSAGKLSGEQRLALDEAVRMFPQNAALLYGVALAHAQHGLVDRARECIERGQPLARDDSLRERFVRLREAIAASDF